VDHTTATVQLLSKVNPTTSLLQLGVALLTASTGSASEKGSSTIPTSASLSYIKHVFSCFSETTNDLQLSLSFVRSLAELEYPHFGSMVKPLVIKFVGPYLSGGCERQKDDVWAILECLGWLYEKGQLKGGVKADIWEDVVKNLGENAEAGESVCFSGSS
jgi:hypothetical protein